MHAYSCTISAVLVAADAEANLAKWEAESWRPLIEAYPACAKAPGGVGELGGQLLLARAAQGLGSAWSGAVHAKGLLLMLLGDEGCSMPHEETSMHMSQHAPR